VLFNYENTMTNEELSKLLGVTVRELGSLRQGGVLPKKGASAEEIISHLFSRIGTKSKKDQKLDQEIRKLEIQNEKQLGNLVEKTLVEDHIRKIYTNISSTFRTLSEQILNSIVADPKHRDTNRGIIENKCRRALTSIGDGENAV